MHLDSGNRGLSLRHIDRAMEKLSFGGSDRPMKWTSASSYQPKFSTERNVLRVPYEELEIPPAFQKLIDRGFYYRPIEKFAHTELSSTTPYSLDTARDTGRYLWIIQKYESDDKGTAQRTIAACKESRYEKVENVEDTLNEWIRAAHA